MFRIDPGAQPGFEPRFTRRVGKRAAGNGRWNRTGGSSGAFSLSRYPTSDCNRREQWFESRPGSQSERFCEPGRNSSSSKISMSSFAGWTVTRLRTHCRASDCSWGVKAPKAVPKSLSVRCRSRVVANAQAMIQFLLGIPQIVLYGCGVLIAVAFVMSIALFWKTRRVGYPDGPGSWLPRVSVSGLPTVRSAFGQVQPSPSHHRRHRD
jgi:hypothetical protein